YAAFLPALAAQVGIATSVVPWILLADQAIFMVCDYLAGKFADRAGDAVARLGRQIALVTVVSCAAFLALPLVAPGGSAVLLVAVMAIWSVTSSMLRAPPLAMASRLAARPQRGWLAGLYALGLGAAGAVSPYVAPRLAAFDPRIPFIATSCVVAVVVLALAALPHGAVVSGERARGGPARSEPGEPVPRGAFLAAIAVLAIGAQVHGAITSAALYLRYAPRDELADLLPVFWIGFALAALVVPPLIRRVGGLVVMAAAGVVGTAALVIAALGGSLAAVTAAQGVAGVGWGGMLTGAFAAAGARRAPGATTGLVFSMLAAATVARIAFVASGLAAAPGVAAAAPWIAPGAWGLGTLIAGALALGRRYGT
ncbi:MAG: MFS transporter, partial [Deltaproteobacteria bacterium]